MATRIAGSLFHHVESQAWTFGAQQGFVVAEAPDWLLAASCAALSKERLPAIPKNDFIHLAPDFVVEVRAPDEPWESTVAKCGVWIAHGVRCAWSVDPVERTICMHRPDELPIVCRGQDRATASPFLPDFSIQVESLFADL